MKQNNNKKVFKNKTESVCVQTTQNAKKIKRKRKRLKLDIQSIFTNIKHVKEFPPAISRLDITM